MRRLLPPAATRTISDWASQADPKGVLRNFDPESTKKAAHPSRPLGVAQPPAGLMPQARENCQVQEDRGFYPSGLAGGKPLVGIDKVET